MNSPPSIRPLTIEDAASFRALRLESLRLYPIAFEAAQEEEESLPLAYFENLLAGPGPERINLGAFDKTGRLRAIARVQRREGMKVRHKAVIGGIYVQECCRGHGAARALLQACIEGARKMGVEYVQLKAAASNQGAIRLYESLGFKSWGIDPAALKIGGTFHDEIHMLLKL